MGKVDASSLNGTLNLLILQSLSDGPLHGLGIARQIHSVTSDVLQIEEGALYPALHRLEKDGLLSARWGISDQNRRAKFYDLTPAGRKRHESEIQSWVRHIDAVSRVLQLDAMRAAGVGTSS